MNPVSITSLWHAGGPMMWPIGICSICALTLIITKWFFLTSVRNSMNLLSPKIFDMIRQNKIKEAIGLCDRNISLAAHVLKAGLLKFGTPRQEIKECVENAVELEIPELERGLVPLITIANLSPLLGLLGTVMGLTILFANIHSHDTGLRPVMASDLAGGIWQALLSTIGGLIVAIPSMSAYNYFVVKVNGTINDLNRLGQNLVEMLTRLYESSILAKSEISE